MGRHRKKKKNEEVELNLAAMLDMAFQLLTFFILTFKPAPVEGQIGLRMPPPQPVTAVKNAQQAGSDKNNNAAAGLETLTITVVPTSSGTIGSILIGEDPIGYSRLRGKLAEIFGDQGTVFEQVIVQVGSGLRYDALMDVINVCTQQTLQDGKTKLTKLSFVELPDGT